MLLDTLILGLDSGYLKHHLLPRQLVVDPCKRIQLVVHSRRVLIVQEDLLDALPALREPLSAPNHFRGEDEVVEHLVVHGRERPRARALLRLAVVSARGFGHDPPLGQEHDVAVGELLLQLARQALLDLVVGGQAGHGHKDDNGLAPLANLDLARRVELQRAQCGTQVAD